jgi:hypothetical protein
VRHCLFAGWLFSGGWRTRAARPRRMPVPAVARFLSASETCGRSRCGVGDPRTARVPRRWGLAALVRQPPRLARQPPRLGHPRPAPSVKSACAVQAAVCGISLRALRSAKTAAIAGKTRPQGDDSSRLSSRLLDLSLRGVVFPPQGARRESEGRHVGTIRAVGFCWCCDGLALCRAVGACDVSRGGAPLRTNGSIERTLTD